VVGTKVCERSPGTGVVRVCPKKLVQIPVDVKVSGVVWEQGSVSSVSPGTGVWRVRPS
jgi:hypothetical protein